MASRLSRGLAAYSDIRIDWVRSLFVILTAFTGGTLARVYLALMFALPVVETREESFASLREQQDVA